MTDKDCGGAQHSADDPTPFGWYYAQQGFRHFTTDREEWECEHNIDEIVPLYTRPAPKPVTVGEPVAEFVKHDAGNFLTLKWREGYAANLGDTFYTADQLAAAVEAEREANAGICDRFGEREMHPHECAAAIRAGSSK